MKAQRVRRTVEFERIENLPRRTDTSDYVNELTSLLKTPTGTQRLRSVQARALIELGTQGGLFGAIGVGEGKTLLSLLSAFVLDAARPLLLLPAGLLEKTRRDLIRYQQHWRIPTNVRLFSYELLGRAQAARELELYRPDLIICDEVHRLANAKAAVTRRVTRYMTDNPNTKFVALSGTMMNRSITDFAHVLEWCLKERSPAPRVSSEIDEWALALDRDVPDETRFEPGALLDWTTPEDGDDPVVAARRAYQRRLFDTPGVIRHTTGEDVGASIYVRALTYDMSAVTHEHVDRLRAAMVTPDGWELMTGAEVWLHVRQLALGFHSAWSPRPPEPWRNARRAWNAYVRDVLARSHTLDSPKQVEDACATGALKTPLYEAWLKVRDTFRPNVVYLWHDDSALKFVQDWMRKPGIVWVEHVAVGRALAERTGAPYYGKLGYTLDGRFIEDADGKSAIIASVSANREGVNLQRAFNRNLVVSPPASSKVWQQLIARTHRPGQPADEVHVDVMFGCYEHIAAWRAALAGAAVVRDTMGETQKLLLADIDTPDVVLDRLTGSLFQKKSGSKYPARMDNTYEEDDAATE